METNSPSRERLLGIDGLRGLAVLCVLVEHAGRSWHLQPGTYAYAWVNHGGLGVTVFFVISGFVITRLLIRDQLRPGRGGAAAFWRARVVRLVPALAVYLAAVAAMSWLGGPRIPAVDLAWSGFGLWNYRGLFVLPDSASAVWFLGHTWSLSLEQQFYLLWPLALLAWGTGRQMRLALAGLILIAPFVRVLSYFLQPETRGMIGMMFHTRMDSLLMGCLLAILETQWRERCRGWRTGVCAGVAAWYCVFLAPWLGRCFGGAYWLPFGFTLDSVLAVLLVIWAVTSPPNWLAGGVLLWIGRISYSLYLWQQFFLGDTVITRWLSWPLALVAAVVTGAASYYCVERPVQRWYAARRSNAGRATP